MNKKIVSIIAIIALVAILGVCLVACNEETYVKRLEKAGYKVETMSQEDVDEFVQQSEIQLDLEWGVGGEKGTDVITILGFGNKEDAEAFERIINMTSNITGMKAEVKGKVLFVGTEQGIKDAK